MRHELIVTEIAISTQNKDKRNHSEVNRINDYIVATLMAQA